MDIDSNEKKRSNDEEVKLALGFQSLVREERYGTQQKRKKRREKI